MPGLQSLRIQKGQRRDTYLCFFFMAPITLEIIP